MAEPRLSGLKEDSVCPGPRAPGNPFQSTMLALADKKPGDSGCPRPVTDQEQLLLQDLTVDRKAECFRALCCKGPPPPRPEYDVVCIGLTGAGKTSLLSRLCSEGTDNIVPTTGFSIKAVPFQNAILNVKELGGADTIKKYWSRYYQGSQGVIFVLDSASSEEDLEVARTELHSALQHPQLCTLPFLILANHQDKPAARSVQEVNFSTKYRYLSDFSPRHFPAVTNPNKSIGSETWQLDSGDCGMRGVSAFLRYGANALAMRGVITFSPTSQTSQGGYLVPCWGGARGRTPPCSATPPGNEESFPTKSQVSLLT
ncbi:hypothetical protein JZ751_011870, partial [Albula glossodonta]